MAVKSVIDIEVNEGQFKAFASKFAAYKDALSQMPAAWKNVGDEIAKTGNTFDQMLGALLVERDISRQIAEAEKAQATAAEKQRKERERAERAGAIHWKEMARTTRDVAGNIVKATESLLRWTGLTAVFSGLLGAGGLYGIDRMASSVAAGRRSSQGLGLGYGEQKAFGIDYGSVVDTGAFLGSVNQALHSWEGKAGFIGAGMAPGEMEGSTGNVGSALLGHLKTIADNTNPAGLSNVMKARGLDQFVTLEDMMRLKAMSPDEFKNFQSRNAADSQNLNLSRDTQDKWLAFTQQMSRAGVEIENVFVKGLVRLEPQLERISAGIVKMIEAVSQSPTIQKWMGQLADGLGHFADYVGTPEFQQKVDNFVEFLGKLGDAVVDAYHKIGGLVDDYEGRSHPDGSERPWWSKMLHPYATDVDWSKPPGSDRSIEPDDRTSFFTFRGKRETIGRPSPSTPTSALSQFQDLEKSQKLPSGLLDAIYKAESDSGRNTGPSSAGAVGPFQLLPSTAQQYGVRDPNDLGQSAAGAARMLADLSREFKGDLAKMAAAYNWGSGNVESYLKTGKGMYGQDLPQETINYLAKISETLSKQAGHKIVLDIKNNSGGNVVISSAQVAQ